MLLTKQYVKVGPHKGGHRGHCQIGHDHTGLAQYSGENFRTVIVGKVILRVN